MEPVTESDIRESFVNCSKGDAKRLPVPRDLDDLPWDDLDFLGWRAPSLPGRGYLVVPHDDRLVGVALRYPTPGSGRAQMCAICKTTHTGGASR
ncbi:FBP C-terminal treble-clef zinc-finger [Rhodococcus tukisamuensis]|uniref:FBP C-terminal treble-clef zinc-finger n=1 Tax=Rhodococcus tukisamuensis TaxID=168276 RepID=A0A1G6WHZ4_9NOCA|nr:FBP C-terminal treble-clef zinc-finger [Rhodococcus tukisamuensis]